MDCEPVGESRHGTAGAPRHIVVVRISPRLIVASVLSLLGTGIAILVAHLRLYGAKRVPYPEYAISKRYPPR